MAERRGSRRSRKRKFGRNEARELLEVRNEDKPKAEGKPRRSRSEGAKAGKAGMVGRAPAERVRNGQIEREMRRQAARERLTIPSMPSPTSQDGIRRAADARDAIQDRRKSRQPAGRGRRNGNKAPDRVPPVSPGMKIRAQAARQLPRVTAGTKPTGSGAPKRPTPSSSSSYSPKKSGPKPSIAKAPTAAKPWSGAELGPEKKKRRAVQR